MGYKEIDLRISVYASEDEFIKQIRKKYHLNKFTFQIILKSLDARNKANIVWQYRVGIVSEELKGGVREIEKQLVVPRNKSGKKVLVVGSGPAGIFSALVLAESGFKVILIERGSPVKERQHAIKNFEQSGTFDNKNNYAFGEGGAGTFSDGKLTSRTKSISLEKKYIFSSFIEAGAPAEIEYMTHPHLGSDNLVKITENLRKKLESLGGEILFNTQVNDIFIYNDKLVGIETTEGKLEADYFVFGIGNSAFESFKMLINKGVKFQTKNFAVGMRAEHPQELINIAQWGVPNLHQIKAAEYRLTAKDAENYPVYSFCMCPGGMVVPATAYQHTNVVNGMSYYKRDNHLANAAVVAGIHPEEILKEKNSPLAAIDWLESLEMKFYDFSGSYKAPAVLISDFINNKTSDNLPGTSYPFGLIQADMKELLPDRIIRSLKNGLSQFNKMLKGYEKGVLIGLESKTSSPLQVVRHPEKLFATYCNLFVVGEGSGRAGGIVSSAADGIKAALSVIQ